MILESLKTSDKSEAVALLARHCESPELLYVSVQYLNGEFAVEVQRPTKCARVNLEPPPLTPLRPDRSTSGRCSG